MAGCLALTFSKMKYFIPIVLLFCAYTSFADRQKLIDKFFDGIEGVRADYRKSYSKDLKKCDRVTIYLLDFDDIKETRDPFSGEKEEKQRMRICRYGDRAVAILKEKKLNEKEKERILTVIAKQVSVEEQYGGAFCHFPIHGIRAYSGEQLLLESTFCWVCGNFGFEYPDGSQWLDTTGQMEEIFNEYLPIPQSEIERFRKKYPSALPDKGEPAGTGQPMQPARKSENHLNH
jgi:hypothetical protein